MAVREFDRVSSDELRIATGALSNMTYGTVAFLVKILDATDFNDIFYPHDSVGNNIGGVGVDDTTANIFWFDGTDVSEGQSLSTGIWYLIISRKPTGLNEPRFSIYNYSTGSWSHQLGNIEVVDWSSGPGVSGTIRFAFEGSFGFCDLRIAARAAWSNSLGPSDAWTADTSGDDAIEAAGLHDALFNWVAAAPSALWRFNQDDTADDVTDLTGNDADQTSLSGTTVVTADDPPGFDFGLDYARQFDGIDDDIVTDVGALSAMTFGTVAALLKQVNTPADTFFGLQNGGAAGLQILFFTGNQLVWFRAGGGTDTSSGPTVDNPNDYLLVVARKASGTTAPRFSVKNLSTGTWTHADGDTAISDPGAVGVSGTVAFNFAAGEFFAGRIVARAAWADALPFTADASGDTAIEESGLETHLSNWFKTSPDALWRFDQATINELVTDLTGNGADQSAIVGTSVVADVPEGFSFELEPVRDFDGNDDDIVTSVGALSAMQYGTVAVIFARGLPLVGTGNSRYFALHDDTDDAKLNTWISTSSNRLIWHDGEGGSSSTGPVVGDADWRLVVVRKATGSAIPRWSVYNFATDSWLHEDAGAAVPDSPVAGATGTVRFTLEGSDAFEGLVAARAAWANALPFTADELGDLEIERSGLENELQNWRDLRVGVVEVDDDFNSYTQGNALDTESTDWDVFDETTGIGTGQMFIDQHDDHSDGSLVVDMSGAGIDWAIYQTQVSSADHYAEADCYVDNLTGANSRINEVGPIVRGNQSSASGGTFDGYRAQLERHENGVGEDSETFLRIYRIDDNVRTLLASSVDIAGQSYDGSDSLTAATIRLEADGDRLTAYSNGVELVSVTDSTHTAGTFTGVRMQREAATLDSQPFFDNFAAGRLVTISPDALWAFNQDEALNVETQTSQESVDTTTHTVSLPDGSDVIGRRVIVIVGVDGNPAITAPTDWTLVPGATGGTADVESRAWYRDIDGTEGFTGTGDTITFGTSVAEQSNHNSYLISGHDADTVPDAASVTGGDDTPDPPSLTPPWGTGPNLWIASAAARFAHTFSSAPTDYINLLAQNGGDGNAPLGSAQRVFDAASQDPGTFGGGTNSRWVGFTIAVRLNDIVSDLTGNGADQIDSTGTEVVINDPVPGFGYELGVLEEAVSATVSHGLVLGHSVAVTVEATVTVAVSHGLVLGHSVAVDQVVTAAVSHGLVLGHSVTAFVGDAVAAVVSHGLVLGHSVTIDIQVTAFNMEVVALEPVLRHTNAGAPVFRVRSVGAPAFLVRVALSPAFSEREAGAPAFAHGGAEPVTLVPKAAQEPEFVDREAGEPATSHGPAGEPMRGV